MKISNSSGSALQLTVIGYQFPNTTDEQYDANWLRIHIKASISERSWGLTDPCLLTWEVERLAQWFQAIRLGQPVERECDFIEPVLSFRLIEDEAGRQNIRVYFELEARPPWAAFDSAGREDVWIDFPTGEIDLEGVVKSLTSQLQSYPKRAMPIK